MLDADADAVSGEMRDLARRERAALRAAVRRFLARGRLARFAACLVVGVAAVVWLAIASAVLRVLVVAVLVLIVVGCVWLIAGIWLGEQADGRGFGESASRVVVRWVRRAVAQPEAEPVAPRDERVASRGITGDGEELGLRERELAEREAAFAVVRSSVDAVIPDLLRRQERLHADAEELHLKLADQIEAMRAVVARMAELEHGVSVPARSDAQPIHAHAAGAQPRPPEPEATEFGQRSELDLHAARVEVEIDLRLEKVEEQEQVLRELEEQLNRRERQLADLVAQTQSQMNAREPERQKPRLASLQ